MDDGSGNNWQERCERYFTSLTDNDKQREREKKMKYRRQKENWDTLAGVAKTDNNSIKEKVQYWFRALDMHGIHFAGFIKNSIECAVWILITIIACGAFAFLLYLTINGYVNQKSHFQINSFSSLNKRHPRTYVTVCNLNLLKRTSLERNQSRLSKLASINSGIFNPQPVSLTETLIKNTGLWSIIESSYQKEASPFFLELDQEFFPYSGMAGANDWSSLYGASITYGFDILKTAVQPTISELELHGHNPDDMIVKCLTSNSGVCQLSFVEDIHPYQGKCTTFNVSENIDKLSLILNSEPLEYIPVLSPSVGMSIQVYSTDSSVYNTRRHFVSPGKHLDIISKKITSISKKKDCSENADHSVQKCRNNCIDNLTYKYCQCHMDRIHSNQCQINIKFEYVCWRVVQKLQSIGLLNCDCLSKCGEMMFETDSTSISWPSNQHMEHLESALQGKNFNKSTIKSSLSYVTINIQPEIYEELSEEQSIKLLDMLTRIGGVSALMVGVSMVTVFQVMWLLFKLCFHTAASRRRSETEETVEQLADSEITSITWQAYKNRNNGEARSQRFPPQDLTNGITRNNSRRSYLEPIEEDQMSRTNNNRVTVVEDQLFSHPWERTGHRRPYSMVINSNRTGGDEFPLFDYIENRSSSPLPRCSTPDNSDYRSTARLVPSEGDVRMFPLRNRVMSPADVIKSYGTPSANKYQYSGPFYL